MKSKWRNFWTGAIEYASRFFSRLAQGLSVRNRSSAIIKRNDWKVIAWYITDGHRVELQEHESGRRWQIEVFERQWVCRNVPFCKTSYENFNDARREFHRRDD